MKFHPRYVAYATTHGKTPEAMLASDYAQAVRMFESSLGMVMVPFLHWHDQETYLWLNTFPVPERAYVKEFWEKDPELTGQHDAWLSVRAKAIAAEKAGR